jgi:hypothetical protein
LQLSSTLRDDVSIIKADGTLEALQVSFPNSFFLVAAAFECECPSD